MVSKHYCNTIPLTCYRVLNSSLGRLDLGGLGSKSPYRTGACHVIHRDSDPCILSQELSAHLSYGEQRHLPCFRPLYIKSRVKRHPMIWQAMLTYPALNPIRQ